MNIGYMDIKEYMDLTLTRVVFEYIFSSRKPTQALNLTLTRVVFELW